jgi:hypothetical protein
LLSLSGLLALALTLWFAIGAGAVVDQSGFEDDDGNLVVNDTTTPLFDWNGFAPVPWTGTAPLRVASDTASGWTFNGAEDYQATTSDSGFGGGTKQDKECAKVITQKADNKADLKRYYLSFKTINGDTFLNLAWVRIPQNTTSPSAHVAFEFNQGSTACGAASDGLVERTPDDASTPDDNEGDILIVYDFEGGSTDAPHITLRTWVDTGTCEISSDNPPCWGPADDLTDLGFAEAKVNTFGSVQDALTPPLNGSAGDSVTAPLGTSEFGETGINLTDAGINTAIGCGGFANTFAVSRTSGNSGTAQMKDIVGPLNLANECGVSTAQKWLPQDTATVTGATTGTVTFTLYDGSGSCTTGTGVTTRTFTDSTVPYETDNTTYETAGKTISWKATFQAKDSNGNPVGSPVSGPCETTTVTVDNDTSD